MFATDAIHVRAQSGAHGQPPSRSALIPQVAQYELVASLAIARLSAVTGATARPAKQTTRRKILRDAPVRGLSALKVSQFNALWGDTPRRYSMIRRLGEARSFEFCFVTGRIMYPILGYLEIGVHETCRSPYLVWFGGYHRGAWLIWSLSGPPFAKSARFYSAALWPGEGTTTPGPRNLDIMVRGASITNVLADAYPRGDSGPWNSKFRDWCTTLW